MNRKKMDKWFQYGVVILLVILIINLYSAFSINKLVDHQKMAVEEANKPAEIALIYLTSSCTDCSKTDTIVEEIKKLNVKIIKELTIEGMTEKGKELAQEYKITKLPSLIVKGEITKLSLESFETVNDASVFRGVVVPYQDITSGETKGKVKTIIINDKTCTGCSDLNLIVDGLKSGGMIFSENQVIESTKAKDLIEKYAVKKLPALLISEEIEAYPVSANLAQGGINKNKGYYLIESNPPYIDVKTKSLRGNIKLTLVDDKSCKECFDANVINQLISSIGLSFTEVKTIDINSVEGGKAKTQYNLDKIPTSIISGDLTAYEGLDLFWKQLGTIESDGSYIFRNYKQLGQNIKIKDITSGKIEDLLATQ